MALDILEFRRSCGECTDEELVKVVWEIDRSVQTPDQAKSWIWVLAKRLLETDRYLLAGSLLWGEALFDCRPKVVGQLFHAVRTSQNLIVLGAAAVGKTYNLCVFCLLEWLRDSETEIKVISTTGGHAKSGAFSTLQRLYTSAIVPLPGLSMDGFIGISPRDRHNAISLVAIPQGEDGRGVLQGYHPMPRSKPHPVFGSISRVRALLDEAEEIPSGVWEGVANLLASGFGVEHVKVMCATNPRDVTSKLAQLAEPAGKSWVSIDLENDVEWTSSSGWRVIRLDGASTENVVSRENRFLGFLTFEGYQKFAQELGGHSPKYLTFGRGMYPLSELDQVLIDFALLEHNIGQYIFSGRVIGAGGLDLASEGGDRVVLVSGQYGKAIGFQPANGKPILFPKPKYAVQVSQFFEMPKMKTIALASEVEAKCRSLQILPAWLVVDRTGLGVGCHDALCEQWSGDIRGVMFGSEAGNRKILADDHDFCVELYENLSCTMYMTVRKYLEFGLMAFHPQIQTSQLFKELSSRRYQPSSGKGPSGKPRIKLEDKKSYKKRLGWSPDIADALVMMVHGCALNGPEKASMIGSTKAPRFRGPDANIGPRERTAYIDFSQDL